MAMAGTIPTQTLEKFTTFGDLLRFLRRRTGLTQLELSIAVGYSDAQITRLEKNQRPPDIPTIETRFVEALRLEHEPEAVARLLDLAANVRREDAPSFGVCPYKGLSYFDEADADLFVGREALTAKLTQRVLAIASGDERSEIRFLAIVGASGSGKSSLVRAGLVPSLRWEKKSADWQIHILTPTARPLESLAAGLTRSVSETEQLIDDLARDGRSLHLFVAREFQSRRTARLFLVIDQFEELYALCRSEDERTAFIDNLLNAASEKDGPVLVVITLRADFYTQCAAHPALRGALATQQEYIGIMSAVELRRAIEEPAERGHWELEPGLVELLMHDVGHEPGALPLLSHALMETWGRRRGRTITLSGYASSGGVRGAIAETAEEVFTDRFSHEQQAIARRIFLRLTELGDETSTGDTRRRAMFSELVLKPEETEITRAVLTALADARLITLSEDSAEVAHEALIREWPTLRGWLEDDREGLRLHRQLTEAAEDWGSAVRDPDLLYRGTRLAQARDWAATNDAELNALEREFLQASIDSSKREAGEREAQRQRELESAQRLAESESRAANQLRRRAYLLTGAFTLAVLLAGVAAFLGNQASQSAAVAQESALMAQRNADEAQQNAVTAHNAQATAQAERDRANAEYARADAERLAAEANSLSLSNGDLDLIDLLTVRSILTQYTLLGDTMLTSPARVEPPMVFQEHTPIFGVDISPDGRYLAASGNEGAAELWELATGKVVRTFVPASEAGGLATGVKFSHDGKYLASAGDDGVGRLWDVASGELIRVFAGCHGVAGFSPDDKYLLCDSWPSATARLWDVATGKTAQTFTGVNVVGRSAYSADGRYVAIASDEVRVFDSQTGAQVRSFPAPAGAAAITLSPDGRYIAFGDDEGRGDDIRLWDVRSGKLVRQFSGHTDYIQTLKFSPDGSYLLSAGNDRTARLWDVGTGQTVRVFGGHGGAVYDAAFSADGSQIATGSGDMIARVWNLKPSPLAREFSGGPAGGADQVHLSFTPDGKRLFATGQDGAAHVWDTATGQMIRTFKGHGSPLKETLLSPDASLLLTVDQDGNGELWDAASGNEVRGLERDKPVGYLARFTPDGKQIVDIVGDYAQSLDVQTGQRLAGYSLPFSGWLLALTPDGKSGVSSDTNGRVDLVDLASTTELMSFSGHVGGVPRGDVSPNGKFLLTGGLDGTARLWDIATGRELRRFAGHPGGVWNIHFSPDGKYVVTCGHDGLTHVSEAQTGQEVRRFVETVDPCGFTPDGKYIFTSGTDGTGRLWPLDYHETVRAFCAIVTRDFTAEERQQYHIPDDGPTCPKP